MLTLNAQRSTHLNSRNAQLSTPSTLHTLSLTQGHTVVIDNAEPIRPMYYDELMESMMPHHENRMARINKRAVELGNPYAPDLYWGWIPTYINSVNLNQMISFSGG